MKNDDYNLKKGRKERKEDLQELWRVMFEFYFIYISEFLLFHFKPIVYSFQISHG